MAVSGRRLGIALLAPKNPHSSIRLQGFSISHDVSSAAPHIGGSYPIAQIIKTYAGGIRHGGSTESALAFRGNTHPNHPFVLRFPRSFLHPARSCPFHASRAFSKFYSSSLLSPPYAIIFSGPRLRNPSQFPSDFEPEFPSP